MEEERRQGKRRMDDDFKNVILNAVTRLESKVDDIYKLLSTVTLQSSENKTRIDKLEEITKAINHLSTQAVENKTRINGIIGDAEKIEILQKCSENYKTRIEALERTIFVQWIPAAISLFVSIVGGIILYVLLHK